MNNLHYCFTVSSTPLSSLNIRIDGSFFIISYLYPLRFVQDPIQHGESLSPLQKWGFLVLFHSIPCFLAFTDTIIITRVGRFWVPHGKVHDRRKAACNIQPNHKLQYPIIITIINNPQVTLDHSAVRSLLPISVITIQLVMSGLGSDSSKPEPEDQYDEFGMIL